MFARVRGFSRPLLISLRNTFRQRLRLALTLLTLSLGGAIFIASFNVRFSIENYVDRLGRYFVADVNLTFDQPYRIERVTHDLQQVPGVERVEGWGGDAGTGCQSRRQIPARASRCSALLQPAIDRAHPARWALDRAW